MSLLMVIVVLSNIAPYKYGHVKIPVFIDGHFKLRWYSVISTMMLLVNMIIFCIIIEIYDYNDIALRAPHVGIKCFYLEKVIRIWWL